MSDSTVTKNDTIRWVVQSAITTGIPTAIGVFTGSFSKVGEFAAENTWDVFIWTFAFAAIGFIVGIIARDRHIERRVSEKEEEIERLERICGEIAEKVESNTRAINGLLARELRSLKLLDGEE